MRECSGNEHFWDADRVDGDTCGCGRFYLNETTAGQMTVSESDDPVPASPAESTPRYALEQALTLAKEATNGWACYAKQDMEHKDIARLHREIDAARQALAASPATPETKE